MKPLARALAALDAGDDEAAIAALVEAWGKRRSPVLADLVELIDARQPEHPFAELIATKADTTRKRLSAAPIDPRLSRALMDLLAQPQFLTDKAFWDLVIARIRDCADPRMIDVLPAAIELLGTRLSPKALRDSVVRRFKQLEIATAKKPSAADAELETQIAQRLGGAKSRRDAEAEVLAQIYEDPTADAPRLVYADLLSERGDPRGELIALQFERRDKGLDESKKARERWLLKKHMKEWLGGLAPAVSNTQSYSASTFERGFVSIADIYLSAEKQLPNTWSDPGWATVEELRGPFIYDILRSAPLRGLRRIAGVDTRCLALVAKRPEKFRHVESLEIYTTVTAFEDAHYQAAFAECEGLPTLHTLTITFGGGVLLDNVARMLNAAVAKRLKRLVIGARMSNSYDSDLVQHETLLAALAQVKGIVPALAIVPPWRASPIPPPVELALGNSGYR